MTLIPAQTNQREIFHNRSNYAQIVIQSGEQRVIHYVSLLASSGDNSCSLYSQVVFLLPVSRRGLKGSGFPRFSNSMRPTMHSEQQEVVRTLRDGVSELPPRKQFSKPSSITSARSTEFTFIHGGKFLARGCRYNRSDNPCSRVSNTIFYQLSPAKSVNGNCLGNEEKGNGENLIHWKRAFQIESLRYVAVK